MFETIASGLARFTTRRPWLAIIAVLAVAIGLSALGRPEMSNDSAEFAPEDPAITASERIEALFGEESGVQPLQVVLVADSGDIVSSAGLAAASTVVDALESVEIDGARLTDFLVEQPGAGAITSFMSPVELAVANGAPTPTTDAEVKALLESGLAFAPPPQAELLNGLFEGGLAEGPAAPAGLMLAFFETPDDAASFELLAQLQGEFSATLQSTSFAGVEALPFSVPLIFQAGEDAGFEIPLLLFSAIGIIGLALLFVFWTAAPMRRFQRIRRTSADTLLALLVVMFAITTTDGMAVLLGPDNLGLIGNVSGPSSIVSILLVGLGVDYVIHLNSAYRKGLGQGEAVQSAMGHSVRIVGGALVLSALTTAFGFLTNVFAGSTALLTFGVLAAVGIGAAFLYANLLFPAARVLLDRRAASAEKLPHEAFATTERSWIDRLTGATAVIPRRAPWVAVGLAGLVLVGAALTATNLRSGFSFLDFVPEGAAVRAAAAELDDRFDGGLGETTSVLVEGDLAEPAAWNAALAATAAAGRLDDVVAIDGAPLVESTPELVAALATAGSPEFDPSVSAAVAAAGLDTSLEAPAGADVAAVLEAVRTAAPEQLAAVYTPDASLYTFTTQAGSDGALRLATELEAAFGPSSIATSTQIIDAAVVESTSITQLQSLVLALLGAGALLMLNYFVSDRRPLLGLLTILPVGGVVILLYAFMVLVGFEFGPVTATLAAVVIGVGVDYTIHVTHRFQEFLREGVGIDQAVTRTLQTTGSALLASALTTSLGFAILTQSSLIPFQQLGWLTLVAIVGSALVAVLVLPSMLVLYARRSERSEQEPEGEAIPIMGGIQSQARPR
ncbi:MAG: MMPL family transporter [Candidatus Limnocylindrales bacterium]